MYNFNTEEVWVIVDGHCDSISPMADGNRDLAVESEQGHLDIPRMEKAGVDVQVMAMWVDDRFLPGKAMKRTMALADTMYRLVQECSGVSIAGSSQQLDECIRKGQRALVMAIEGGESLEGSIEALRIYHRLGVRMMTLTWNRRNELADGVMEGDTNGRLTRFGRQVVEEMGRLGMVVDISHLSPAGFWDVMSRVSGPVVASHSCVHSLCEHPRNLRDDQLRAIAQSGGVVGVCFYPLFLDRDRFKRNLRRVADHVEYMMDLMGPEHVALGSDFDGDETMAEGLEDVTRLPALLEELLERGIPPQSVKLFAGENWLRVFGKVWKDKKSADNSGTRQHIHHTR